MHGLDLDLAGLGRGLLDQRASPLGGDDAVVGPPQSGTAPDPPHVARGEEQQWLLY